MLLDYQMPPQYDVEVLKALTEAGLTLQEIIALENFTRGIEVN